MEHHTCHMRSHSFTWNLTQVNVPHLNTSKTCWFSIYLLQRDGRLSWPLWVVMYQDSLPVHKQWVGHPSSNHLIATRPGVEPTTLRLQVQQPTIMPKSHPVLLLLLLLLQLTLHTSLNVFSRLPHRPSHCCSGSGRKHTACSGWEGSSTSRWHAELACAATACKSQVLHWHWARHQQLW